MKGRQLRKVMDREAKQVLHRRAQPNRSTRTNGPYAPRKKQKDNSDREIADYCRREPTPRRY